MTIGERIAQIRKERGLSQEAFGESLGVTRQSISKWESDSSIPDVDKLLAINKLYGVSIGWILGEDVPPTQEKEQELTEEQLLMVEKIVEKYIAAIPVTKPKKWKGWQKALAGFGGVLVGFWTIQFINEVYALNDNYVSLINDIGRMENTMYSEMNGMAGRIEEILEKQNHMLAYYETNVESVNIENETVTMSAAVVPKNYVNGMTVEFLFESEGQVYTAVAIEGEGNKFICEYEFPYSDMINISVVLKNGEMEQTQLVDCYEGIASSTRVNVCIRNFDLWGSISATQETQELLAYIFHPEKEWTNGQITAKEVTWRIFVNDTLVEEIPARLAKQTAYDMENELIAMGEMDYALVRNLKSGDVLYIITVVTDNYDRTYVAGIDGYQRNDNFMDNYYNADGAETDKWLE